MSGAAEGYLPRIADGELRRRLESTGAVVIEGPKAVGKTATARQAARSEVLLDVDSQAQEALLVEPALVLDGAAPRLLDEWQTAPQLWDHVRRAVDDRRAPGQFILTGSATPSDDERRHTGAGRFSSLRMRPMCLYESGDATGAVSLAGLLEGQPARAPDPGTTVARIAELVVRGGFPAQVGRPVEDAARAAIDYLDQIRHRDVPRVAAGRRDPAKVGRLLTSLARNVATEVPVTVLAADAGGPDGPLARNTVADYLDVLERLMITEDQRAWAPHLRSRAILRSAPKRHLADPCLAAAALRARPERLLRDLSLLGNLFESMAIRDLRAIAQPLDAEILHHRDSSGLEVDAIVQCPDGRWAAIEVKLGGGMVDRAAQSLRRFADVVDVRRCGAPAALSVITATGYAYRRSDGIDVIPITTLGP